MPIAASGKPWQMGRGAGEDAEATSLREGARRALLETGMTPEQADHLVAFAAAAGEHLSDEFEAELTRAARKLVEVVQPGRNWDEIPADEQQRWRAGVELVLDEFEDDEDES